MNATATISIGQECYLARYTGNEWNFTKAKVVKITPAGKIDAQIDGYDSVIRFDNSHSKDYKECGKKYNVRLLRFDLDVVQQEIAEQNRRQATDSTARNIAEKIAACKGYYGYSVSPETKAELLNLVESL